MKLFLITFESKRDLGFFFELFGYRIGITARLVLNMFICKIVNLSLESGVFAENWKNALVHPLLKKAGLKPINKTGEQLAGYIKDHGKVRGYPITRSYDSQQLISCPPKRISAESQH